MDKSSKRCGKCGEKAVGVDEFTGDIVCHACGYIVDDDHFTTAWDFATADGAGNYVGEKDVRATGNYSYKEVKRAKTMERLDHITSQLKLPAMKMDDVRYMVEKITEDQWGIGRWIDVLIGACSYVVARQKSLPITLVEVAVAVECDVAELGRMYNRVLKFLDISPPSLDLFIFLERAVSNLPAFSEVEEETKERISRHGRLLLQCAYQWFLTTGRHHVPIVAAVLGLIAEVHGVKVGIKDVSKELNVPLHTSKLRYNEFKELLVKVGQKLPWGKDITVKNIVKHAAVILQYIEIKDRGKAKVDDPAKGIGSGMVSNCNITKEFAKFGSSGPARGYPPEKNGCSSGNTLGPIVYPIEKNGFPLEKNGYQNGKKGYSSEKNGCLSKNFKENGYPNKKKGDPLAKEGVNGGGQSDQINVVENQRVGSVECNEKDKGEGEQVDAQCLAGLYQKFNKEIDSMKAKGSDEGLRNKQREVLLPWNESSSRGMKGLGISLVPCHRISMDAILKKQSESEAMPPSFLANAEARVRRREKIDAAKSRIEEAKRSIRRKCEIPEGENESPGLKFQSPEEKSQITEEKSQSPQECVEDDDLEWTLIVEEKEEDAVLEEKGEDVVEERNEDSMQGSAAEYRSEKKGKRKHRDGRTVDWEDSVIECLLLHGVEEEKIEDGNYRTLLNLHVFKSNGHISDKEIATYIRSQLEVSILAALYEEEEPYPWVRKDDL